MPKKQKSIPANSKPEADKGRACLYLHPTGNAARAIYSFENSDPALRPADLVNALYEKTLKFKDDSHSTAYLEGLLFNQLHVLQSLFTKATTHTANALSIPQAQTWGHIALKAHDSCRKTAMALHELRNPKKTVFIKQTNQALRQQVNNAPLSDKTENFQQNLSNELLSEIPHATLDRTRKIETSQPHSQLEAVAQSRCENKARERD